MPGKKNTEIKVKKISAQKTTLIRGIVRAFVNKDKRAYASLAVVLVLALGVALNRASHALALTTTFLARYDGESLNADYAFGLIALIVASLGTFNVLTVNLLERTKEVGLMKALGMRKRDIYLIFMAEAFLISLIGGLVGLGAGVALGNFGNYMLKMAAMRSGAEVVQIFYTPLVFSVGCALFSLAVGFMTGWYPARRAVRINAIDALRFE